jgi:hypothetical protein
VPPEAVSGRRGVALATAAWLVGASSAARTSGREFEAPATRARADAPVARTGATPADSADADRLDSVLESAARAGFAGLVLVGRGGEVR